MTSKDSIRRRVEEFELSGVVSKCDKCVSKDENGVCLQEQEETKAKLLNTDASQSPKKLMEERMINSEHMIHHVCKAH